MAGRKSDFTLTRLDDLFTTQAQREEERLSKIRDIPLELIDDFPDHLRLGTMKICNSLSRVSRSVE